MQLAVCERQSDAACVVQLSAVVFQVVAPECCCLVRLALVGVGGWGHGCEDLALKNSYRGCLNVPQELTGKPQRGTTCPRLPLEQPCQTKGIPISLKPKSSTGAPCLVLKFAMRTELGFSRKRRGDCCLDARAAGAGEDELRPQRAKGALCPAQGVGCKDLALQMPAGCVAVSRQPLRGHSRLKPCQFPRSLEGGEACYLLQRQMLHTSSFQPL